MKKLTLQNWHIPRYMEAKDPPVHETMLTYVEKSIEFPTYHLKHSSDNWNGQTMVNKSLSTITSIAENHT